MIKPLLIGGGKTFETRDDFKNELELFAEVLEDFKNKMADAEKTESGTTAVLELILLYYKHILHVADVAKII